ncbi:MAG: NAD-dependent epimerase/dehydratase family protein [Armatimonadota bacterium]
MRIFLTGGTGFVGGHIRQALRQAGYEIVALTRRPQPPEAGVTWATGDLDEVDALVDHLDGAQAVVHLAGIIKEHGEQTFQRVYVHGTAHVLEAMRRLRISRLLHMSALGTGPKSTTGYFQAKWKAEELVRAAGIDYTIFRPSIIFGPGDGFVNLLATQLRRLPITPVVGKGYYRLAPISIHAVAAAFVQALQLNGPTLAKTFELCGPEVLTYRQILDSISACLGLRKARIYLPVWFVSLFSRIATVLHLPTPITPDQITMLLLESVCADPSARDVFTLPPITLADGMEEYLC